MLEMADGRTSRKRKRGGDASDKPTKQRRVDGQLQKADAVKHALLAQYYPSLQTLREYVLSKLPSSSRLRRKKIASIGASSGTGTCSETEADLARLLDTTLVGFTSNDDSGPKEDNRWEKWAGFSQRADESYVTLSEGTSALFSQSEIVDFAVWCLFSREKNASKWPKNLLCDGFRRQTTAVAARRAPGLDCAIPGLFAVHRNHRIQTLKEAPWPQLLALLGKAGERVMIDLLLDSALFVSPGPNVSSLYQISGVPLTELEPTNSASRHREVPDRSERSPVEISFVRSRMLYARANLNAKGSVRFGFRHIHVLNRLPLGEQLRVADAAEGQDANRSLLHIMMYMFPRQFGLHNPFTSEVDHTQTAQRFQDYTLREDEIASRFNRVGDDGVPTKVHVPKRLRGKAQDLVEKMRVLHQRCSYAMLLEHYCPVSAENIDGDNTASQRVATERGSRPAGRKGNSNKRKAQPTSASKSLRYSTLVELATPIAQVTAFCQSVLTKIIPNDFWGHGSTQEQNKRHFLSKVDHFIRMRRFESMTLHEVMQDLKIIDLEWLTPPALHGQKTSQTDMRKRTEIFYEFLYYVFDSLLIPLIRSNFYVTESSFHRYRLFFFRHDVWRRVAEPAMAALKTKMFEEVKIADALRILDSRRLGFSQVRLLPKDLTMRPIMNLRRRALARGNKKILGPSINSILGPVYDMMKREKSIHPTLLGSSLFSVGDIYQRIKEFKSRIGQDQREFYFAKVDVTSAFDTIPQDAMLALMDRVPTEDAYKILKHAEVRPAETRGSFIGSKVSKRWRSLAVAAKGSGTLIEGMATGLVAGKKHSVFVDSVANKTHHADALLNLMSSHVKQNLVRIGKKYYRQRDGIPQGSVLSSLLCNYFYADLERRHLPFLQAEDCLLLRLIDDFLLITTDKSKAQGFVEVMLRGLPEYGVTVNPNKSLVNFAMSTDGHPTPMIGAGQGFPYCGTRLDCSTLDMAKDRENAKDTVISNSLTVEFSRYPGQNFTRKTLNAFKIQSHLMFYDTSHNTSRAALDNLYSAFLETAAKAWAYARAMPKQKQPQPSLVISTIRDLIKVAYILLTSKSRMARTPGYKCAITKAQVAWLALFGFRQVLARKQAKYQEVLSWLDKELVRVSRRKDSRPELLEQVVRGSSLASTA